MSLFSVSLFDKEIDSSRNCLLGKRAARTESQCFGGFSKALEEVTDQASQFFIQESELWNEDDKDVFEPIKLNKQKKNSPRAVEKREEHGEGSKSETESSTTFSPVSQRETGKPGPAEEEEEKKEEEEEDKLDLDLSAYNVKDPKNEVNFGLVDESDEDIVVLESPRRAPPSPTFRLSHKPATKKCDKDSKKEDSESCFKFEVDDSCLDKGEEEEKSSFSISKGQVNSLGLGEKTDQWLSTLLQNEAFSNVGSDTPVEKLQANLAFLNKSYVEILEKVMTAFENLPLELLSQFPEFDPNVYITLRTTRRRIKAILIKTENLLKRSSLESKTPEERKSFDWGSENDFPRQRQHSDLGSEGGKSFGFQQQLISESKTPKSNFSSPLLGDSTSLSNRKLNFPGPASPNPESFSRSEVDMTNSSTPMLGSMGKPNRSNMIDYTDVLLKTPGKSIQMSQMNTRNDSTSGEFDGLNFPHSEEIVRIFREKFGLKTFRPNQLQVINAALLGHDCFVLMPTGGGKSLCYQLPALVSKGVTIVISPLRSLILDQVTKLLTLDIAAAHLSGDIKESEAMSVYSKLNQREPKIKLLYVTPEKVGISSALRNCLMGLYRRQMLARFVIDEAHCVSQWGHDFRPDYKKLRELRENFPDVKIMALTATATPRVRTDILHQLKVDNPKWFLSSFNRSNLTYSVKDKKGKSIVKEIAMLIQNEFKKDSGVVYCLSRKECELVAKDLKTYGVPAIAYHAGMKDEERSRVQNMWMNDKVKVVCATIAFGMGIDKLDVRFVIHYSLPKSIEGYYQESGRAGRDGEKAVCVLYYCYRDKFRLMKLITENEGSMEAKKVHMDNLYRVVAFAENKTDCRRALQLEYFGEKFDRSFCLQNRSTACDNCLSQGVYETIDATEESRAIVSAVKEVCGSGERRKANYTMLHFVDVFKGTVLKKVISEGHDRLPMYGLGKSWQRNDAERLFRKLVMEEFLRERLQVQEEGITFAYISFGRRGEELLKGNVRITFEVKKVKGSAAAQPVSVKSERRDNPAILEIQEKCYGDLMDAIHEIASSINCNPNAIMNVQALRAMSSNLPETPDEMLSINHVTRANFEKYGGVLLEITKKYAEQKRSALAAEEVPEEDAFTRKLGRQSRAIEDSPYFETEIEYVGRGRGGGKRKRGTRKAQKPSKKFKGGQGQSSRSSGEASKSGGSTRGRGKGRGGGSVRATDGSGVTTVPGVKFSTLMELPTNTARGYARPRVVLKNL